MVKLFQMPIKEHHITITQNTEMRTKTVERLLKEIENRPWHLKLGDWWNIKRWVWTCRTRFIWDLSYERNIFRKKNNA